MTRRVKLTSALFDSVDGVRYRPGVYNDFPDHIPLPSAGAYELDKAGKVLKRDAEAEQARATALAKGSEEAAPRVLDGPPLDDGTDELEQKEPETNLLTNKATGADPKASGPKDPAGNKIGQK